MNNIISSHNENILNQIKLTEEQELIYNQLI